MNAGTLLHRGNQAGEMGDQLPYVDLGTIDGTPTGAPLKAKRIFVGGAFSCALLEDDTLKCWGFNDLGQLGLGDITNRGDTLGDMGNNLARVQLSATPVELAIGQDHMCVLLADATVRCWGVGAAGRTGYGITGALGWNINNTPNLLPAVSITDGVGSPLEVLAIAAGGDHTCVIVDAAGAPVGANVKCWGGNALGELGQGHISNRGDAVGEMGANLLFTNLGGTAIAIAAGENHTCALLDDDTVKCWGGAAGGALGNGTINLNLGNGPGQMGASLPLVSLE